MADNMMLYKYVVKNVARKHGKTATFMPKPLFEDNASGMHVHHSLWKGEHPCSSARRGYAGLSEMGRYAIGGLLQPRRALCGLCAPTTNSYKRLVPGYEAPVNLAYSQRNRSACCRIPMYKPNPRASGSSSARPTQPAIGYLAFAAMMMAGIDGIDKDRSRRARWTRTSTTSPAEEKAGSRRPARWMRRFKALEDDHDFLLHGRVFTEDVIDNWISYKRKNEVDAMALRPAPYEFCLYYDM